MINLPVMRVCHRIISIDSSSRPRILGNAIVEAQGIVAII